MLAGHGARGASCVEPGWRDGVLRTLERPRRSESRRGQEAQREVEEEARPRVHGRKAGTRIFRMPGRCQNVKT